MEKPEYVSVQDWRRIEPGWWPLKWVVGLFSLLLRSGGELTHLAGQMHRTWSETPPVFNLAPQTDTDENGGQGIPKTYLLIRMLLAQGADRLHQMVNHLPVQDGLPVSMRRLHSGMNGVFGDKLQEWAHPLALTLDLVDAQGYSLRLDRLQAQFPNGVVLFVHGLCLSECDWQTAENQRFVAELQAQGRGVAWVRYNSGLPVWENGAVLSALLDQQWQLHDTAQSLTLIGHSMGGLIIRSALHHAEHIHPASWLNAVENAAYLATPHAGAPLEKIGNFANSLLGVSPYSKPLMALGNIRSLGIRSLRHGNIVTPVDDSEQQYPVPFNSGIRHLLLAARMGEEPAKRWLGDGLVPVSSAMGEGHFPPQHPGIERVFLDQVGHISLLGDDRLYDALRTWLALPAASH